MNTRDVRAAAVAAVEAGLVPGVEIVETLDGPDDNAPHGSNTEEEMA